MSEESEKLKSAPWNDDEYIHVNGVKLVYTIKHNGDIIVRFPGGLSKSVQSLITDGHVITMPKSIRKSNFI